MDTFYGMTLGLLFVFAIFDLVIGVGNDAVNFLNSALGSKVASRNTIMIFASLGIFLGAILSSGMMEIARTGIFNPSRFYFSDIFLIFLSVMITDIILLDVFNTLGLPTSTTVSIVFSLLGASFIISLIKISSPLSKESIYFLGYYIKTTRILSMISGIFLSIIISFFSGTFIHYFVRCIFSFNYVKKLKSIGSILWAGLSLSSMTYFLIIEGIHGALKELIPEQITGIFYLLNYFLIWLNENFYLFILILFLFWILVSWLFSLMKLNIIKFIVLYGTFALAMAFSGNDLVNFIGVPIAGFQSYLIWIKGKSHNQENIIMNELSNNVQISSSVLLFAGIIMILTIWFSKKVRIVADTEINLGRQHNEIDEKFSSNFLARYIVKFFLWIGRKFFKLFPKRFLVKIEKNFKNNRNNDIVAFDIVRASSNLTISSILISIATLKKLPLSTTFVTFMVAMGTSLSDRAWDRESAVYRVSGVIKVINGWILTGAIAFIMSAIFAIFLYIFKGVAIIILIFFIIFVIFKNYKSYKNFENKKYIYNSNISIINKLTFNKTLNKVHNLITSILESIINIYDYCIDGISKENVNLLQKNRKFYSELKEKFNNSNNTLIKEIRKSKINQPIIGIIYIKIYDEVQEIVESINIITNKSLEHIINSHKPLKSKQIKNLFFLKNLILNYLNLIYLKMKNCKIDSIYNDFASKNTNINTNVTLNIILKEIDNQLNYQVKGIANEKYGNKNSVLVLNILLRSKHIMENNEKIIKLYIKIFDFFYKSEKNKYKNISN